MRTKGVRGHLVPGLSRDGRRDRLRDHRGTRQRHVGAVGHDGNARHRLGEEFRIVGAHDATHGRDAHGGSVRKGGLQLRRRIAPLAVSKKARLRARSQEIDFESVHRLHPIDQAVGENADGRNGFIVE